MKIQKASCVVNLLLEDDPDFDAEEYMSTPMTEGIDRRIRIAYTQFTPESLENGESSDNGWLNEEGVVMDPDAWDIEDGISAVDKTVNFLKGNNVSQASSSHFHTGVWYTSECQCIDYRTGTDEEKSFFLDNYSEDEEKEIFKQITQRRAP
jgi:hypothetical protein